MASGNITVSRMPLGSLASGTNLNDVVNNCYLLVSGEYPNHPNPGISTTLLCFESGANGLFNMQIAIQYDVIYIRYKGTGGGETWMPWSMFQLSGRGLQPNGTNVDNLTKPGTYGLVASNTYQGTLPTGVTGGILEVIAPAPYDTYVIQRISLGNVKYERYRSASSGMAWGSWYKFTGTLAQ